MGIAQRYIALEIYRSVLLVFVALVGLFLFFDMIDQLDNLSDQFTFGVLLSIQALQAPMHAYVLLPIALLIGAIIALAGLAQRHELMVLNVSGMSPLRLLSMLWIATLPVMVVALLLSEVITPYAETRSGQLNVNTLGKSVGARLATGYWFREPADDGTLRVVNIQRLGANEQLDGVRIYQFNPQGQFQQVLIANTGQVSSSTEGAHLELQQVTQVTNNVDLSQALLDDTAPTQQLIHEQRVETLSLPTSLTYERILASELQPENMSMRDLQKYINHLELSHLEANRQHIALWRKAVYPFTLLVMMTLAAPISFMQTRKGGAGLKIFIGILIGVIFFMINQLALNIGILTQLPPWLPALAPNTVALALALVALYFSERKKRPRH